MYVCMHSYAKGLQLASSWERVRTVGQPWASQVTPEFRTGVGILGRYASALTASFCILLGHRKVIGFRSSAALGWCGEQTA
jgi:hypothetical protein